MVEIGKLNTLRVIKVLDSGVYLDGDNFGEIFLKDASEKYEPNNMIEVFIYLDSHDNITATTNKPYAMSGQFALLKVNSVTSVGAFLDWGLPKDILVPFSEQKQKMVEGKSYIVFIYLDEKSNRLVASSKLNKFLDKKPGKFMEGDSVDLIICDKTDLGFKAIINNTHWGLLYKTDIFQVLKKGQQIKGFIKKVRDDGKIDLCLHKPGFEKVDDLSKKIMNSLEEKGGFIAVTDKTPPEIIYKLFGVSKKTFKNAIGSLYKKRLITIEDNGIKLSGK